MRLSKGFKEILLFILLLVGLPISYGLTAKGIANFRANRFYKTITVGEPISDIIARANSQKIINIEVKENQQHYFIFPGLPFATANCSVKIQNGKVIAKNFKAARD